MKYLVILVAAALLTACSDERSLRQYLTEGQARLNANEHQEALALFNEALKVAPRSDTVYYFRALTYKRLGNFHMSERDFDSAIAINPSFSQAYNNRGIVRSILGDLKGEEADYLMMVKLNPGNYSGFYNCGNCAYDKGDFEKAHEYYSEAIRLKPEYGDAWFNRGLCRDELKDTLGAIDDYTKCLTITMEDPNSPMEAWFRLGNALQLTGNVAEACEKWKKASELGYPAAEEQLAKYCK